MQTSQITKCKGCESLRALYKEVDKRIYQLSRQNWEAKQYGVDQKWCPHTMKHLLHYKRILLSRIYNNTYPDASVDVQDIITQVRFLLTQ